MSQKKKLKKIAFVKIGSFSNTNQSVLNLLKKEFPNYQVDVIDIFEEIAQPKTMRNLFYAIKEHGIKALFSKINLYKCMVQNEYIFKLVKKGVFNYIEPSEYAFTFQTQSLFDTSIEGIPNFVYTDNTTKATSLYPDFDVKKELWSNEWFACEKSIYHNATVNFTMSEDISRSMIQDYGCDPDRVVCAGVAPNANIPSQITTIEDRFQYINILFVGKDWEPKGGPILLEAFQNILKIHPEAKLTIVGCSPDINVPNCTVAGRVPVSKVGDYFAEASIFCLPTHREAFGIVYLEAMAYSLPVIGSNIGAIPEFVCEGKNGYLVQPNNVEELTTKLLQLIESPEQCKAFGLVGRELFLKKYTWDKVGQIMREQIVSYL